MNRLGCGIFFLERAGAMDKTRQDGGNRYGNRAVFFGEGNITDRMQAVSHLALHTDPGTVNGRFCGELTAGRLTAMQEDAPAKHSQHCQQHPGHCLQNPPAGTLPDRFQVIDFRLVRDRRLFRFLHLPIEIAALFTFFQMFRNHLVCCFGSQAVNIQRQQIPYHFTWNLCHVQTPFAVSPGPGNRSPWPSFRSCRRSRRSPGMIMFRKCADT